jgi:hypothetical protein
LPTARTLKYTLALCLLQKVIFMNKIFFLVETEKTFGFPLDIKIQLEHKRVAVVFGERDGIKIGHSLLAVNGTTVTVNNGRPVLENDLNGKDVFEVCFELVKLLNYISRLKIISILKRLSKT